MPRSVVRFDYELERFLLEEQKAVVDNMAEGGPGNYADYMKLVGIFRGIQFALMKIEEIRAAIAAGEDR